MCLGSCRHYPYCPPQPQTHEGSDCTCCARAQRDCHARPVRKRPTRATHTCIVFFHPARLALGGWSLFCGFHETRHTHPCKASLATSSTTATPPLPCIPLLTCHALTFTCHAHVTPLPCNSTLSLPFRVDASQVPLFPGPHQPGLAHVSSASAGVTVSQSFKCAEHRSCTLTCALPTGIRC